MAPSLRSNMNSQQYLFTSDRLGFRGWQPTDLEDLYLLCSDPEVMRHFPATLSQEETAAFLQRLIDHQSEHGYSYFAVEQLTDGAVIGFTGLAYQTYAAPFTPCIDLGWRLRPPYWGKGYASEGARRCIAWAGEHKLAGRVYAVAVSGNEPSLRVMRAVGMTPGEQFYHPNLPRDSHWQPLSAYFIDL